MTITLRIEGRKDARHDGGCRKCPCCPCSQYGRIKGIGSFSFISYSIIAAPVSFYLFCENCSHFLAKGSNLMQGALVQAFHTTDREDCL